MEVIEIKEQEDGSAIVELDVTEDEKQMLMNIGFETMIRQGMNTMEIKQDIKKTVEDIDTTK
jgi:hypothetical protein